MKQITLVTAKIIRENDKYAYRLKAKGEKYIVQHEANESAEQKVLCELTPFAKVPVSIESVVLQKNSEVLFSGEKEEECCIFKISAKFVYFDEGTGKEMKQTRKFLVSATCIDVAMNTVLKVEPEATIVSVSKTNIIDILI